MADETMTGAAVSESRWRLGAGIAGGVVGIVLLSAPPPPGLTVEAWRVAAVAVVMAIWWVSEAIPLAATAMLPLAAFPLLGVRPIATTAAPYANPVIFLFLGGFLVGAALARCGLHRRMALAVLRAVGSGPAQVIGGFMVATAFLSLWVSNTATVVMMLPMTAPVVARVPAEQRRRFAVALLLGIAYAASLGGLGTLIGTPPNALLAGYLAEAHGRTVGFAEWMGFALPLVCVTLPLCWLLLVRWLHPVAGIELGSGPAALRREAEELGPLHASEWRVGVVTGLVCGGWILQPLLAPRLPGLSDAGIAMLGALALFLLPGRDGRALSDEDLVGLPWNVLLLFGGGLSLASAIEGTGLAGWMGGGLGALATWPWWAVVCLVTLTVVLLTELTSNTATAAALLPVAGATAVAMGLDPWILAVPVTLAASCAFMMPVATPPNALVYGTGHLTIRDMVQAGIWLNVLLTVAITLLVLLWGPIALG